MSENVSMLSRILRSVNNLKSKAKSEGNNQSILENPVIFEGEYICCLLETDGSI